jgi:ATP-binding cassette subfamily F protein 3
LVGPNGAGKSTLLKLLAGVEPASAGELIWTANVERGYFAQHQLEQLNPAHTILESLMQIVPTWTQTELRSYLGSFLFSGEAVDKKVAVLSGGETSRLALARMLSRPAHMILLDEPTNHLDMQSRDVVENAIRDYAGSVVCISHDRHFLNAVTNLIWSVGGGEIKHYEGNYDYYEWKNSQVDSEPDGEERSGPKATRTSDHSERRKMSNRLKKLPELIAAMEAAIVETDRTLALPETNRDHMALMEAMERKRKQEEEYLHLLEEQEALEQKLGSIANKKAPT